MIDVYNDVYYSNDYISLYLKKSDRVFQFEYQDDRNIFINKSIKRAINKIGHIDINEGFYDLETAYGYGGFYTNTQDQKFIQKAMYAYQEKCRNEKIIAEFIRFHPYNTFPELFSRFLDFLHNDRDTVFIETNQDYKSIKMGYSASLKRNINKAVKNNLTYVSLPLTDINMKKFVEMYNKTMYKNNADQFYFFDNNYFKLLSGLRNVELHAVMLEDKFLSMAIIFNTGYHLYYHLGATEPEFYNLNPSPFLFDSIIQYCNDDIISFYLGGGSSPKKEDSLLKFKNKFSSSTTPFYISGVIYNKSKYEEYNNIWYHQSKQNINYFLKYRQGI
jgi:lipid II:glycine glycyltransferase (peptidoglycan interpeptide bridge formation enzyme)